MVIIHVIYLGEDVTAKIGNPIHSRMGSTVLACENVEDTSDSWVNCWAHPFHPHSTISYGDQRMACW